MGLARKLLSQLSACLKQIGSKTIEFNTQTDENVVPRSSQRMKRSYINQVYMYIKYSSFLHSQISCPIFMMTICLYSPFSIHLSPPLVLFLGNPLDAYPIKALLEVMRGAVSWYDTVQVSFLHKCG